MAVKRYVMIGTGARGIGMFARPLVKESWDHAQLVALMDVNRKRLATANQLLETDLPTYTDFDQMMAQVDPDGLIVTSRDDTHAPYVIQGLQAGKRVYCEKPLCINLEQCQAIQQAAQTSAGDVFVTHNVRYQADRQLLRSLLQSGKVGQVQHIEFRYNLDLSHGAAYFRRWHGYKKHSGGLMVHKASHHFDFLNWLIGDRPDRLRAQGGTYVYGKASPFRGQRCLGCEHAAKCPFYIDIEADDHLRQLYLESEKEDGYIRDRCLFDPAIDAEDHITVNYTYQNGVRVNYLLVAYASHEGNSIAIQGTKGRLEYDVMTMRKADQNNPLTRIRRLAFYDYWTNTAETIELPEHQEDGHGGADPLLRQDFFNRPWDAPRPNEMADVDEAIQAVLIGAAANESMARNGEELDVQSLLNTPQAAAV